MVLPEHPGGRRLWLLPSFFMSKQTQAKELIKKALADRGVQADFGIVLIAEQPWQVFEYNTRCIAVDENSGVWVGLYGGEWRCVSSSCTVSSALEAIEYLLCE